SSDVSFLVFMPNGGVNTTGAPISGTISYTGTAIDGVDYSGPSSFSIPAGASVDTIDIVVLDDAIQEPNETIIATISNVNTGYIVNETRDALIADDDAQSLVISMTSPADAVEGTSDVIFNVFLEGGVINNSGAPITGTFFFLNSSALFGADFAPLNGFSIPVGASSTTVTLTVYDDPILEPTEIIDILIVGLNIGAPGNTMAQAQIIDDDSGQYSLSMSQLTNGVEGASDMEFTVSLDNGVINTSGAPITGSINYSGSANPFNDCLSTPSAFSIPNGSNSTQITIPIYDDILVECDESLTAMIDDPNIGSIGTDSDVAYIIDDECALAVVSIHSPSDGAELGSDVEFIVSFDGNVLNGTGAVISGTLDLSGGTAIPGVDFVNQQTFQIGIGVNSTTVSIPVIDEFDIEATESVVATISNISFGVIGTNTSTAFIADNDSVSGIHPVESIDLSVFPNPMNNLLSLRAENHIKHYRILDAKGMVISDGEIEAKTADVDVEFLSSGVYVINVLFENGNSLNRKLVKE
ncbi:MAG: Calx-beta domain-containing protein, partial [Crocinitomicaceae bacterium]